MKGILVVVVLVLSVVIEVNSEHRMPDYTRIKRAKYYSSPPQRFYRRPPFSFPTSGAFSYTPPPGYAMEDDEPHPPHSRPFKVSKRPTNEGLGEEDISNMIKYLSKQDLEKIIEAAAEKDKQAPERYLDNRIKHREPENFPGFRKYSQDGPPNKYVEQGPNQYKEPFQSNPNYEKYSQDGPDRQLSKREENVQIYKPEVKEIDEHRFARGPYVNGYQEEKPYVIEYAQKENYVRVTTPPSVIYATPQPIHVPNVPLDGAETSDPFNFVNTYIRNELNDSPGVSVESKVMEEEHLPRPMNLREEQDYEVSFTNNVPTVAKSESYKIENFGSLPIMDYTNTKLHSVSSYHVPHYTITSPKMPPPRTYGPSNPAPPVEPAPPVSEANGQSDAHLKAIKIWTHKSRGTAYTLHNDGSLSLERPDKPKPVYGSS